MNHLFFDDYSEGAHPALLDALAETNDTQQRGYGEDEYCLAAADRIRERFGVPHADVHFVPTGTATNLISLASMLRPYEGVIASNAGHVSTHETGAIEATGHKVIEVPPEHGKLTIASLDQAMATFEDEHTVLPRVVYLTQATELGTVYRQNELQTLVDAARSKNLLTFVDGARLAMALASPLSGTTLSQFGEFGFDMFWIGGTKVGGIFGEALVIVNDELKSHFRFHLKQRGAMLAKGRFIGLQFERFFHDDLWLELGAASNERTHQLAAGLAELGVQQAYPLETNQLFVVLPIPVMEQLQTMYGFYRWEAHSPGHDVVRLVCSWATPESAIAHFLEDAAEVLSTHR